MAIMIFRLFLYFLASLIETLISSNTPCDTLLKNTTFYTTANVKQCISRVQHDDIFERINAVCLLKTRAITPSKLQWLRYKRQFSKSYANSTEELFRCITFQDNVRRIEIHNQRHKEGRESYFLKVTEFADLTDEEFRVTYLGPGGRGYLEPTSNQPKFLKNPPASMDWRRRGYVTVVKNQRTCGSCWAFGAVAAIEGQYFRRFGELKNLSEQQLVDCVYPKRSGCLGGSPISAYFYVMDKGITYQKDYPYVAKSGVCNYTSKMMTAIISDYVILPSKDEALMKRAIATVGPITVAFYMPPPMRLYGGGFYNAQNCPEGMSNHVVAIVGYGVTEGKKDYWLLKNSLGPQWGLDGYFMLPRGVGFCALDLFASFPEVPKNV